MRDCSFASFLTAKIGPARELVAGSGTVGAYSDEVRAPYPTFHGIGGSPSLFVQTPNTEKESKPNHTMMQLRLSYEYE